MDVYQFEPDRVLKAYEAVGGQVVDLIERIPVEELDTPAVAPWSVRELVAHTLGAFKTVTLYLDVGLEVELEGPSGYYRAAFASGISAADIEGKAQEAAQSLDDLSMARVEYQRSIEALETHHPQSAVVKTLFGVMTLRDYLPTRIVELVAHGEDIKKATGLEMEFDSEASTIAAITCAGFASDSNAVMALTGRRADYNVLSFDQGA